MCVRVLPDHARPPVTWCGNNGASHFRGCGVPQGLVISLGWFPDSRVKVRSFKGACYRFMLCRPLVTCLCNGGVSFSWVCGVRSGLVNECWCPAEHYYKAEHKPQPTWCNSYLLTCPLPALVATNLTSPSTYTRQSSLYSPLHHTTNLHLHTTSSSPSIFFLSHSPLT